VLLHLGDYERKHATLQKGSFVERQIDGKGKAEQNRSIFGGKGWEKEEKTKSDPAHI